jgi:HEAT repeat protein
METGMKEHDEIREILRTFAASPNSVFSAEDACDALREYGEALVDVLTDALCDPDEDVRRLVLSLLDVLEDKCEPALPALIKVLKDSDRVARILAADLLGQRGQKAKAAVPILETWVGSKDRSSHIKALGNIMRIDPSRVDDLLPLLIDTLQSEDGIFQLEAVWMIGCLGEMALAAIPALKRRLHDHSTVSMSASDAIHQITGDPADAIMVGLKLLDHAEWLQRYVGAEHLRDLGSQACSAIPRLRRAATDDTDDGVRNAAKMALHKIEVCCTSCSKVRG